MIPSDIEKYVGFWRSASGQRIVVRSSTRRMAKVSLFDTHGRPIIRPYLNNSPTVDLPARYNEREWVLEVDLWDRKTAFCLSLCHETEYLSNKTWRHFLSTGITRCAADEHLIQYYSLFGKLETYEREPNSESCVTQQPSHDSG